MMTLVVLGNDGDDHSHDHDGGASGDDGSVIAMLSLSSFSQVYKMPQVNFRKNVAPFSLLLPSFFLW